MDVWMGKVEIIKSWRTLLGGLRSCETKSL